MFPIKESKQKNWNRRLEHIQLSEVAFLVWNGALTQQDERAMERIQRTALAIIRGENHTTYKEALDHFKMDTLKDRSLQLKLERTPNSHIGLQKTKILKVSSYHS